MDTEHKISLLSHGPPLLGTGQGRGFLVCQAKSWLSIITHGAGFEAGTNSDMDLRGAFACQTLAHHFPSIKPLKCQHPEYLCPRGCSLHDLVVIIYCPGSTGPRHRESSECLWPSRQKLSANIWGKQGPFLLPIWH